MGLTERHWFEDEEPELTEDQLEDILWENNKIFERGYQKGFSDGKSAILRDQEPRVLTAEEVQEDELVWIEVPQSDEIWPALLRETDWFGHPKLEMRGFAIARSFLPNRYGKDWRCWTARPTDEQREAAKWE